MLHTLNTNICSYILRHHPANMIERFTSLNRGDLWLSAIVAADLRLGAAKLGASRFKAAVEAWLAGFDVRPWPLDATHHYADIRSRLERAGKPIGCMDLMIAAHAMAEDSVIITNNARELRGAPGLAVEEWAIETP
ncbi:type II toxin-antitoxin system VapC family toxin [Thauera sp. WH-1]|uniref:type II toxin-antitoxin system VapC family toxin n=1 Tax=Thauera sp. WH-1 TaxID=3398230 RepID=UPI0039FBDB5E